MEVNWLSNDTFEIGGYQFLSSFFGATHEEAAAQGKIYAMKSPDLFKVYKDWITPLSPKTFVEVGVAGGGSAVAFHEYYKPDKLCLIDIDDVLGNLSRRYLVEHRQTISMDLNVDQGDQNLVESVVRNSIGDAPIDVVIDDASHLYEPALATFELLFPKLRPGGAYIIEDWGWSHWPGDYWQSPTSDWASRAGLSNLVMQATIATASRPDWISRVFVNQSACVIERGPADIPPRSPINDYYVNRGKPFNLV